MAYRIVHWGTGNVGALALRAMMERPDIEIVGHYVHNPEKIGRDSAELVGLSPSGLAATDDLDALIALRPDVVTWFGNATFDPLGAARTMARFLKAGSNVVTSAMYELGSAEAAPAAFREVIEPACRRGNSTIYTSGFDPGFATTQLAVTCYGIAHRVEQVRLQEFADYGAYPDEAALRDYMGFGGALDAKSALSDGEMQRRMWTPTVFDNARALGLTVDEYRFRHRTAPALADRQTSIGQIDRGTTSVSYFELIGVVGGEERIVLSHVNWMHSDDIPADWPVPPRYRGRIAPVGYRISVVGKPSFDVEVQVPATFDGLLGTAIHVVNAIPAVVAAPAGIMGQDRIVPYAPSPLREGMPLL